MPPLPLRDLFRSDRPDRVTHEIILVHGFKSCSEKKSRSTECRRILQSWVVDEIKPISKFVNVRTFDFDSAHILHNGGPSLYRTALELSTSITATKDPTSPLFCSNRNGTRGRSPRAAIFITHGIGCWIVKALLDLRDSQANRIDPTGLFFFDIPEALVAPNPIVNISTRPVVSQYLHEFSNTFKIELKQQKVPELRSKIEEINVKFHNLATARYGRCEELRGRNSRDTSYTTRSMARNIWMSSTPALTFEKSNVKELVRELGCFLGGCGPKIDVHMQRLEGLGLAEELAATISSRGIHNPRQEPPAANVVQAKSSQTNKAPCYPKKSDPANCNKNSSNPTNNPICCPKKNDYSVPSTTPNDPACGSKKNDSTGASATTTPTDPSRCDKKGDFASTSKSPFFTQKEEPVVARKSPFFPRKEDVIDTKASSPCCGNGNGKGKGKEKEHIDPLRMSPVHLSNGASRPLSDIPEDNKGEYNAVSIRPSGHDRIDDEFDLDNIIARRNRAAVEDDEEALRSAIHKLEAVKFHQQDNFENDDPRALITQREILKTSIVYGWWNGKIIQQWEEEDILEIEDQIRKVYVGLEQSIGPHHRETMEALAVLLAVRISIVEEGAFPVAAIQAILDMMKQADNLGETRTPSKLLQTLGLQYKVAFTLSQVSPDGDNLLEKLLEATYKLLGTVDDNTDPDDLAKLRSDIRRNIAEVRGLQELHQYRRE
ncbi:hypothetical protein F4781DRAFT_440843 [Annulohypoxylon bovei var. microspora]|nr:hypothetical protein F4781DRAFT_440843 [Annulohypoxylon bovei var. microspora]